MKTYRLRHSNMAYQSKWKVVETDKPLKKFIYNYMVEHYYIYDAESDRVTPITRLNTVRRYPFRRAIRTG